MNPINDHEVFHSLRVKLYPNHLENIGGRFVARADSEATLTIEEVCAELIKRGGYTGRHDDLVNAVKAYLSEAAYQMGNGYAITTGYYSISPGLSGTFDSLAEVSDRKKHPVTFNFRTLASLRRLAENIVVEAEGIAENTAYIDAFYDVASGTTNELLTPGGIFIVRGDRVKVLGNNAVVGVFLESLEDAETRIKVTGSLAENTPAKIIGTIPQLESQKTYRVVIVSQYSNGNILLKQPRVITGRSLLVAQ